MAPENPTAGTTTTTGNRQSGADALRDTARDTARDFSNEASRLADQARDGVRDGVASARGEAERQANRGIERTAEEVSRTSHALETAASEFDDGSVQHQLLHQAADGLTQISGTLRGKTLGQVASDLANFGRRNPAAFMGGAALAGFAIARFARASRGPVAGSYDAGRYGQHQGGPSGYGVGTMPQPQQPASTHSPYSGTGTTPMAGPASTGTTADSVSAPSTATPSANSGAAGVRPTTATPAPGSSVMNKGKPNV